MVLVSRVSEPEEGLVYSASNVELKINEKVIGTGKLYISQASLAWQPDNMPNGITVGWREISVHGISPTPRSCIFFMLDHKLVWTGVYDGPVHAENGYGGGDAAMAGGGDSCDDEGNETDEEYEDESMQMTELWLIPDDPNSVQTMFQAMSECQALHPDSADSASDESDFMDDDGEDDPDRPPVLGDGDGNREAEAAAQGGMQNLHLDEDDRFADAE